VKIAIVGGAGKMGRWIARFLIAENISVSLIDTDDERLRTAMRELNVEGTSKLINARKADCVIISVPIAVFEQTAKELSRHLRKGQSVIDVTSVKIMPVETMHRLFSGCLVLGAHPVFGPGATSLEGHNVVLTPTTSMETELAERAKIFLETKGARVEVMTPAEHDRLMAAVLGLSHYVAFVAGDTLVEQGNLKGMETVSGVTFRVLMTMISSVFGEDPSLYASIQTHLPDLPILQHRFIEKASEWADLVKQQNTPGLVNKLEALSRQLSGGNPGQDSAYSAMYNIAERR